MCQFVCVGNIGGGKCKYLVGCKKTRLALGKHSRGCLSASKRQHRCISQTFSRNSKYILTSDELIIFLRDNNCTYFRKCVGRDGEKYFGEKRILEMENMEI